MNVLETRQVIIAWGSYREAVRCAKTVLYVPSFDKFDKIPYLRYLTVVRFSIRLQH